MRSYRKALWLISVIACIIGATTAGAVPTSELADFQMFSAPPPANDFQMLDVNGKAVNLSDFRGKVVLLNFWRKDCQYCNMEKGYLKHLARSIDSDDLKVVCVNFWDQPAWVREFAKQSADNLVVMSKPEGKRGVVQNSVHGRIMGYFLVNDANEAIYEVKGFPSTYVIDKQGKVVAVHLGMAKWTLPAVRNWVAGLVGKVASADGASKQRGEWLDRLMLKKTN